MNENTRRLLTLARHQTDGGRSVAENKKGNAAGNRMDPVSYDYSQDTVTWTYCEGTHNARAAINGVVIKVCLATYISSVDGVYYKSKHPTRLLRDAVVRQIDRSLAVRLLHGG